MATPGLCASMLWLQTTQRTEIGYCNKALQFYHRLDMHDLVLVVAAEADMTRLFIRYDSPIHQILLAYDRSGMHPCFKELSLQS